ncbi:MAG TPA: glycosyltransferase family 39 protein [Bacteroidota bacterium]|nr:glycosyltransferase family 39 protein [Bacteroidota bacterium]
MKFINRDIITSTPALYLIVGGLILRLWNIRWSLPEIYEEAYPLTVSWNFWNWGSAGVDLNPHFFNYPALVIYLNFGVQVLHYLIGHFVGTYPTLVSFGNAYTLDPSTFVILSRLLSVLFDVGAMYFTYRLGEAIGGRSVGVIAGLLLAINPLHIRQAHLINVDTPLTFFSILGIYLLYRLIQDPMPKWYTYFGVTAGLAMGSKYTGVILLVVFLVVNLVRWVEIPKSTRRIDLWLIVRTFLWSGLIFFVVNPYSVLNITEFFADLTFEQYHAAYGHLGLDPAQSTVGFYLLKVIPDSFGLPLIVVLLATIIQLVRKRDRRILFLLLFPAVYITVISLWEMRAERYLLPVFPALYVVCSLGVSSITDRIGGLMISRNALSFASGSIRRLILPVIILLSIIIPLQRTWTYHRSYDSKDTRTVAKEVIYRNLPKTSAVVLAPMGLNLGSDYSVLNLPFNPVQTERLSPFYDARWYSDFDLVVLSDYDYARYAREPERFTEILRFYEEVRNTGKVVSEIVPGENQNGPRIWMIALPRQEESTEYPTDLIVKLSRVQHDETILSFLYNLSQVLYTENRLLRCRQVLRICFSIDTTKYEYINDLAWTCFKMGDYSGAIEAAGNALSMQPNRSEMISLKGSILLKLNRYDEAEQFLIKAVSLNDRLLSAYLDLSDVYVRLNKTDMAIQMLVKVRSLVTPGSAEAQFIENRILALTKLK